MSVYKIVFLVNINQSAIKMKNLSILKSSCLLLLVLTIFSSCEKLTLEQADEYIASKLTKNGIRIGLIGEYLFNGNTFDDSGYGNHGTISGNVATSIDRFDKAQSAYLFAPGVNNKITIPNTAHFSLVNSLSISLWVKFNSNWNYHSESLIFKGSYPMNNGWEVNVNQDDSYFGTGNYSFQSAISKGNGPLSPNYKQSFAEINKWRHVCYTYDNRMAKIYLDGVLRDSINVSGALLNNNNNIIIGSSINPVSGTYEKLIDDVRIWNRALKPEEVTYLFTSN